jgi:DNA-binding transcriptional LysR family regulator
MEIHQLRTFQLVSVYKSFTRAAEELNLTQPAVTLQIKGLEQELGELLFDRLGRSLALTPAGEVFLAYVQQILNLADQAVETIRQFSNERGRLTIGAGTTTSIFRLPEILRLYHRSYPQIEIRIRNGDSDLISRLVLENGVDLGFVTTLAPTGNLETLPIFRDRIWLVGPGNFPPQITGKDLGLESLILFRSGSGFGRFLGDQFRKYQFTPRVTMELESIEAIIRLVQSGLGMAFLPEIAVKEELESGVLRKVDIEGWDVFARQTFLIYRRDKYLTWPIKTFLQQISGK